MTRERMTTKRAITAFLKEEQASCRRLQAKAMTFQDRCPAVAENLSYQAWHYGLYIERVLQLLPGLNPSEVRLVARIIRKMQAAYKEIGPSCSPTEA